MLTVSAPQETSGTPDESSKRKLLEGSSIGFFPVSVLFLEGGSRPVGGRDVKDIVTHGEPRASLSVFALLLASVIASWFPCSLRICHHYLHGGELRWRRDQRPESRNSGERYPRTLLPQTHSTFPGCPCLR